MSEISSIGVVPPNRGDDDARQRASQMVARWRGQGFDTLLHHPSGYCSPANSKILRRVLEGYRVHRLGSQEAVDAVAAWLAESEAH